jgi:hypothetical protein
MEGRNFLSAWIFAGGLWIAGLIGLVVAGFIMS